jgi:transposase
MKETCDHCGQSFDVLHVMQHVPGANVGKTYRPQLWCDDCAGVAPGQTPPCPPSVLRADGTCSVCETAHPTAR